MMQVEKDTVVTVVFQVADAQGEVIQEGGAPMVYLHGGYGEVFEALEDALDGKSVGQEVWLQVEPEDAFGQYNAELTRVEPRELFPDVLQVGMQFEGTLSANDVQDDQRYDDDESTIWTVTDLTEDKVILDGNHPLAGIALRYHLVVEGVRPATAEEIERGSYYNPDAEPDVEIAPKIH
jgi:FKBP-type peptidyl-prolyl cis-trans isomerase SlyD